MALSSSQTSEQKIRVRIRAEHFPFLSDNSEQHMRMWQRLVRELNPDGTGSESEPREECEDCDECDVEESFAELFDELEKALGQENGSDGKEEDDGVFQMVTEGRLRMRGNLCEISYQEGEDVYGDAVTNLTFSKRHPETVILSRSGEASLSISFEAGRHHIGSYRLPFLQQEDPDLPHLNLTSYAQDRKSVV